MKSVEILRLIGKSSLFVVGKMAERVESRNLSDPAASDRSDL